MAVSDNLSRIKRLREQAMKRTGSWVDHYNPFVHDAALLQVPTGLTMLETRGQKLRHIVEFGPVAIYPDWHLAGEHLIPGPMDWNSYFGSRMESAEKESKRLPELGLEPSDLPRLKERVQAYFDLREQAWQGLDIDDEMLEGGGRWHDRENTTVVFWNGGWVENHSVRDYAKVLRLGFVGIEQEVRQAMDAAVDADEKQRQFWESALAICEAGRRLGERYAEYAERLAKQASDADEKARYAHMASLCRQVPANKARTLEEAAQSLWFAHILTAAEDGINANSIGRLDQILQPYYAADIAAGRMTREDAVALMAELACKLYLDYDVQAITLGGCLADGSDATNDMSRIILEATRQVDFIRDISVRLHDETPDDFLQQCAEMVIQGGGIPFFFNDKCFLPALISHGIDAKDAWDYAPIGCIELTIPGKANPHAVSGWINAAKWLELALYGGVEPRSGKQMGPQTPKLTEMTSYEQLEQAYLTQMKFFTDRMVTLCNLGESAQRKGGPLPYWSLLTDNCIAKGRDLTDGGAQYLYHSICLLGTANTADSLIAVKKLVFEQEKIGKEELLTALKEDFQGHESLRQMLLRGVPKYGNDIAEVDEIAAWVDNQFIDLLDQYRSPLGGNYVAHLFSFRCNIEFGWALGATPDGRHCGTPIAYSLSAQQGRDEEGISAMLNSLAKLPHDRSAGATAAIVDVDPNLVKDWDGLVRLKQLLRSAIAMNVGQLQMNVVTVERLRQAQEEPEKYGHIPVRVAGYSQKFCLLTPELQEHVIARTKHAQ